MKQGSRRWPDKERILWLMTDDAEWDAVGWQRHTVACGRDDISAEIDREGRLMEYLNCGVRTIASVEARDEVSERLAAALKHFSAEQITLVQSAMPLASPRY